MSPDKWLIWKGAEVRSGPAPRLLRSGFGRASAIMVTEPRRQELRRHPRARISWPTIVEAGNRLLHGETLNLSAFGAKVRLEERLPEGTLATLHLKPLQGEPVAVQAIVWRADDDGPAFFFIEAAPLVVQPSQSPPSSSTRAGAARGLRAR